MLTKRKISREFSQGEQTIIHLAVSRCSAAGHGSFKTTKVPGSPTFTKDFDGKAYSNVLEINDICLELPSDPEGYFGFVVDEFSKLVHTIKYYAMFTHLRFVFVA